jgi:serine/threonine protein kinase
MPRITRKVFRKKRTVRRRGVRQNTVIGGTDFNSVGSGSYGCVVAPANTCSGNATSVAPDNGYVAKYMTNKDAYLEELQGYDLMKKADSAGEFSIPLKESCEMNSLDNQIAQSTKCTADFLDALSENIVDKRPSYKLIVEKGDPSRFLPKGSTAEDLFRELLDMMMPVFEGLVKMKQAGIIHADIKSTNMVIKNDKFKLIDYGLTVERKSFRSTSSSGKQGYVISRAIHFETPYYKYWPRESHMLWMWLTQQRLYNPTLWNVDSLKRLSRIINDKDFTLTQGEITDMVSNFEQTFEKCLDTFDVYGLGVTIYEFLNLSTKLHYAAMPISMKELIKMMTTPKVKERAQPEEVLDWVVKYLKTPVV